MNPSQIRTLTDVLRWLSNDVEWTTVAIEDMALAARRVLEEHIDQNPPRDAAGDIWTAETETAGTIVIGGPQNKPIWPEKHYVLHSQYFSLEQEYLASRRHIRRLQLDEEIESDRITDVELELHNRLQDLVTVANSSVETIANSSVLIAQEVARAVANLYAATERASASPVVDPVKNKTALQQAEARVAELEAQLRRAGQRARLL